jgi:hypothetical protein
MKPSINLVKRRRTSNLTNNLLFGLVGMIDFQ